jgi:hypothetical protein
LDPRWSGLVNNQFHIIHVDARDDRTGVVHGLVESWTYLCGHGWVPSRENNGIAHKMPFGTYTMPEELRRRVAPAIEEHLAHRQFMAWSDVVRTFPELAHLPPGRVVEVLDSLASLMGFRRHGVEPNEILILKVH